MRTKRSAEGRLLHVMRAASHSIGWPLRIAACKGEGPAPGSNFVDHAVDLTEFCLLGNVAIRSGQPIQWDAARMTCSNLPAADRFVRKAYRVY